LKKPLEVCMVLLCIIAITFSSLSFFLFWESNRGQVEVSYMYLVRVYTENQCRLYVLVNYKTIIADEVNVYDTYPLIVFEGDYIEIHGYSETNFTIVLENQWYPIREQTGQAIWLNYTVPKNP
jgi:hypothetical protein